MAIYRGLNTQVSLNDVDSKTEALRNLNLDKRDLDVIFGVSKGDNNITDLDLRMISGLDIDYGKEAKALQEGSNIISQEINEYADISNELRLNADIDGILSANAVKYDYFDFTSETDKKADISTSRVSSWSSAPDDVGGVKIFYGGDIEVIGNVLDVDSLNIVEAPKKIRFSSEIPTHLVTININGSPTEFLAMKGIPVVFEAMFFRSNSLYHRVASTPSNPTAQPNWVSVRQPDQFEAVGASLPSTGSSRTYQNYPSSGGIKITENLYEYRFSGFRTSSRNMEFYYNPDYIEAFGVANTRISALPQQTIEGLKFLDISVNNFVGLPDIKKFAPNLKTLICNGNYLYREIDINTGLSVSANQQLQQRLPSSLKTLMLHSSFRDSEVINLTGVDAPALERFSFRSNFFNYTGYYANTNLSMTGAESDNPNNSGKAPILKPDNLIEYEIYGHGVMTSVPYETIANSTNLKVLHLTWTGINSAKDSSGQLKNIEFITNRNSIERIFKYGGQANLIDVSNSTSIRTYIVAYQYGMNPSLQTSVSDNDIFIVTGGTDNNLQEISCQYSYIVTGDITTGIQSKTNLRSINLYQTSVSGNFTNSSLDGCSSLTSLTLGGSINQFNNDNWFSNSDANTSDGQVFAGAPNLTTLSISFNSGVRGSLPNLSYLTNLSTLSIIYTGLSGNIPSFGSNVQLRTVYLYNNQFTGNVPAMVLPNCYGFYLYNNSLNGTIGKPVMDRVTNYFLQNNALTGAIPNFSDCPRLRNINLSANQLTSYTKGSFAALSNITQINLSNNNLTSGSAVDIINDLGILYNSNDRKRNVTVNLTGNKLISEQQVLGDESSTIRALVNLLRNASWQILMNP